MREIGGYIELERFSGSLYHEDAIALNCGRGCLRYLVEARGIKAIWLPYFLCDSVADTLIRCGVAIKTYSVGSNLLPVLDFEVGPEEYIYLVDYYGQLDDASISVSSELAGGRIIVDETQNFFAMPREGVDTLYTTRKYFGVPDGGFLYTSAPVLELETDRSLERVGYLVGRLEQNAGAFYQDACENNERFAEHPARFMSEFTKNILRGANFEEIIAKRNRNYCYLDQCLSPFNLLKLNVPKGPFAYPLMVKNGPEVRRELAQMNIFVPTLWPNVANDSALRDEVAFARDILPLPVDQRYGCEEMRMIVDALREKGVL